MLMLLPYSPDIHNDNDEEIKGYTYNVTGGKRQMKTIVWYDVQRQSLLSRAAKTTFSHCQISNCRYRFALTKRNATLKHPFDADAVVIQGMAIFELSPPPRRDQNQVFVLAVRDTLPQIRHLDQKAIGKYWVKEFNWTMSFRLDSDVYLPYSYIWERKNTTHLDKKNYDSIFEEKDNDILWFVSHCITKSIREQYVEDLSKVVNVDIVGRCGKNKVCPKGAAHCSDNIVGKYKFYLAFENSFYKDYVTEKLFKFFNEDIIVVVRGATDYSKIAPKGTIIDANDFKSPSELGIFLKKLGADKERYISYLRQKDMYYTTGLNVPSSVAACKLCEYLHSLQKHRKIYDNIQDWWVGGIGKERTKDW